MPAKSKAEMSYLFANKPDVAKEMAQKTPNIKALPERLHPAAKKAVESFASLHGIKFAKNAGRGFKKNP